MNVQTEEKMENSVELLMRCEEGAIVKDLFDKNKMTMKKKKFH